MGQIYKLKIEDITDKAEGIGRIDGKVCFIPNALPGDEVEVEITQDKGRFFKGKIVGENSAVCGGAPLLRMPYEAQLSWKEKHVKDCLERLGAIENPKMNPIISMENPYNYRNKGEFKIDAKLPYCNLDCKDCPIQSKKAMEIVAAFKEDPRKNSVELIVRTAENGEFLAYTIQKNGYELLWAGNKIVHDNIGHIKIEVDPLSFYQVNSIQREKLYSIVKSYVKEGDSMLDFYCGAGTIGLYCSDKCERVIGVESLHEAILMANRNAIINHIVNTTFVEGKAEDVMDQKLQGVKADVVVVDPPRAGCKESLLQTLVKIAPERIVYVSCDPATLARDIKILENLECEDGSKYRFEEATPVDMFPHTVHVETVALLSKAAK